MKEDLLKYPLVDLFAGPGGLGEGFAMCKDGDNRSCFKSVAAIERDEFSHQTLLLRHFLKAFDPGEVPDDYYAYLEGRITKQVLRDKHPDQWAHAEMSALRLSLGPDNHDHIKGLIEDRLRDANKWALIGGPPCQAYSLVGRSRMMSNPEFEQDERHFLYKEYLKIIVDHQPPVFVMENVKGLLSAKNKGEFVIDKIMADLSNPIEAIGEGNAGLHYRLYSLCEKGEVQGAADRKRFVVRAEEYGVPQARHRMFILGIRSDIDVVPGTLKKKKPPTVHQIIGGLPKIRSGVSRQSDSAELWRQVVASVTKTNWSLSDKLLDGQLKKILESALKEGADADFKRSSRLYKRPSAMRSWYCDDRLKVLLAHEARSHMETDLHRYQFAAAYGEALSVSPKLAEFPEELLPAHKNVGAGRAGKMFSDRFRVQVKSRVSTTVTSHISKDGHYFIHYDPAQCRSLSVREAARLQTFPDNYHFEGPRTSQYHQVGNAVPPYLSMQIAGIVKDVLDRMSEK